MGLAPPNNNNDDQSPMNTKSSLFPFQKAMVRDSQLIPDLLQHCKCEPKRRKIIYIFVEMCSDDHGRHFLKCLWSFAEWCRQNWFQSLLLYIAKQGTSKWGGRFVSLNIIHKNALTPMESIHIIID